MLWRVYRVWCGGFWGVVHWVFVFVDSVEFVPFNRWDAVSYGWGGLCVSGVCCKDNMFLCVVCEAVSGNVVG